MRPRYPSPADLVELPGCAWNVSPQQKMKSGNLKDVLFPPLSYTLRDRRRKEPQLHCRLSAQQSWAGREVPRASAIYTRSRHRSLPIWPRRRNNVDCFCRGKGNREAMGILTRSWQNRQKAHERPRSAHSRRSERGHLCSSNGSSHPTTGPAGGC